MTTTTTTNVSLTLIDISKEVGKDKNATTLMSMIKNGEILPHAISARSLSGGEPSSSPPSLSGRSCITSRDDDDNDKKDARTSATQSVQHQVTKYLQTKDKYTSLASILFKSRAFYDYHRLGDSSDDDEPFPVIDLPRTKHNKPYIPTTKSQNKGDCRGHNGSINDWRRRHFSGGSTTTASTPASVMNDISIDEVMFPLSISHQFPFVGIAAKDILTSQSNIDRTHNFGTLESRTHPKQPDGQDRQHDSSNRPAEDETTNTESNTLLLIGLDIVVFEEPNLRLYDSVDEFIDVFYESLSTHEWNRILTIKNQIGDHTDNNSSDDNTEGGGCDDNNPNTNNVSQEPSSMVALHELYVTWAMKEAYTKALGVGMGFNFGGIDIALHFDDMADDDNIDTTNSSLESYWGAIKQRFHDTTIPQKCYVRASGEIRMYDVDGFMTNENSTEVWDFFFVPLNSPSTSTTSAAAGCACVCVGPSYPSHHESTDATDSGRHEITINWETLQSLIEFHKKC